ncbi:hypothetical protein JR316_0007267 [Psilocybe cubensis]|uniref:Uncharacterized protein n=1 Tax=Psilocybe cubensis TaxID=181762 RepID=A0ACB8GZ14_PSICU|nr:hypothetical protein JR316_0007267 [Psilocybe cubensis]KAH9480667.1 hypothetical protein JR316_0007267 [Psilocybe cubensis]
MFLLLLSIGLLSSWEGGIQALPLNVFHPLNLRAANNDPLQCSCPNTRSLQDIVWSCLATIFVCTWVSVHPNVTPPGENWFKRTIRRTWLMFWGLIGPELILSWSIRQWISARSIAKEYKKHSWTMTHAFFLIMGGFVLYKGDEDLGTLTVSLFKELEASNEIDFPVVTEEDLADKSKGDSLSKGLVIVQTTWFMIQCIARAAQGLDITELELVTVAFASMNAVMYFLWWHKPLDVQCRIRVYLKPTSDYAHKNELIRAEEFQVLDNLDAQHLADMMGKVEGDEQIQQSEVSTKPLLRPFAYCVRQSNTILTGIRKRASRFLYLLRQEFRKANVIVVILIRWPMIILIYLFIAPVAELFGTDSSEEEKPGRDTVPTFYSPAMTYQRSQHLTYIFGFSGAVFGAIHCIPWSFQFPTSIEQTMWRVLSLFITLCPLLFAFLQAIGVEERIDNLKVTKASTFDKVIDSLAVLVTLTSMCFLPLYVVARLILLFESFYLLRDVGPSGYLDIDWGNFIPHF